MLTFASTKHKEADENIIKFGSSQNLQKMNERTEAETKGTCEQWTFAPCFLAIWRFLSAANMADLKISETETKQKKTSNSASEGQPQETLFCQLQRATQSHRAFFIFFWSKFNDFSKGNFKNIRCTRGGSQYIMAINNIQSEQSHWLLGGTSHLRWY